MIYFCCICFICSWRIWFRDFVAREEGSQMSLGDDDVFETCRVAGRSETYVSTFTGLKFSIFAEVVPLEP